MTTETTPSAAGNPAASLLFQQAPVFQAPVFQPATPLASSEDRAQTKPKRTRRTKDDESAPAEGADSASTSVSSTQSQGSEDEAPKRARRTRRVATSADVEGASSSQKDSAEDSVDEVRDVAEASGVTSDGSAGDDAAAEGSTRRRRRRRTRSASVSGDGDGDPIDQVKALHGSTRLEAKKQRRKEGRREGRRRVGLSESEFLARRESVKREMVIRDHEGLDQIAVLEDGLLVEHYVARRTHQSMVGNIYLGRVQNVLPSMEAAFVDIGRGRNAVLYAGEVNWDVVGLEGKPRRIEAALKSGDPVLVQVTKDPIGHKGARLTSQITLAGRYLVLIPHGSMMGISRKLPERERLRLKKILRSIVPEGSGVIVRTAAEGATEEQIRDDVERLTKQWADIEAKQKQTKNAPVLLRGEPELAVRVVRDIFNEDFAKLIVEGRDTYNTVKRYVDELSPELSERVEQWVGTDSVFSAHRIDEQLAKGMDRKVWLPSGGTLIIDRTEAMTVIDVNTGKFIGAGGTLEETVTKNNLEAAEEIVRQLRLRDIGGIIIVDFVDMVLESNRDLVLRRLVECLSRDRTRHQVTEITSLGLVQMTRKRVGEGLVEAFSTSCEACEGRGFIVHSHPVESAGGEDNASASKPKRKKVEARRIEDEPERELAKQALSAIAAASRKAEGAKDVKDAGDADALEREDALQEAEPEPKQSAPQVKSAADAPNKDADPLPRGTQAEESQAGSARPKRRRRAVMSGVIDPSAKAAVAQLEAQTAAKEPHLSAQAAPKRTPEEIQLPQAKPAGVGAAEQSAQAPKRQRRVASTGIVDTGTNA